MYVNENNKDSISVHIYDIRTLVKTNTSSAPCGGEHKHSHKDQGHSLCKDGDHIVIACRDNNSLYKMDMRNNEVTAIGQRGDGIGMFNYPTICQVDSKGSMLIADFINARLQVHASGQWSVLHLMPRPRLPVCAMFDGEALYVAERWSQKLLKYSFS